MGLEPFLFCMACQTRLRTDVDHCPACKKQYNIDDPATYKRISNLEQALWFASVVGGASLGVYLTYRSVLEDQAAAPNDPSAGSGAGWMGLFLLIPGCAIAGLMAMCFAKLVISASKFATSALKDWGRSIKKHKN